ncbi:peptidoglycan DD-metalloendopeptidase family protein [Microlunatus elymi]|nr:peptidoglycan DD-metalloendopeptidase family protein [Microlunatus elymi]
MRRFWIHSRLVVGVLLIGVLAVVARAAPAAADPLQTARSGLPEQTSWPLAGSPDVVRGFDPPAQQWGAGHRGVDLSGSPGAPVLAAAAGTISYAGMLAGRGVMVVDHGSLRTTYEPVTAILPVGTKVRAGQQIGTLAAGHCGQDTCLHWGLKRGDSYLDPLLLGPQQSGPVGAVGSGEYRLYPASERQAVTERLQQRPAAAATIPSAGGTDGPLGAAGSHGFSFPVAASITSPYGMRFHPVLHVYKLHDGTDFGAACGTPIKAPYAGTVSAAYFNAGYGNRLMLDHGVVDGRRVVSGFNHATSYRVGVGDRVAKGEVIGYVGTTGYSTGCHLHLMVWLNGQMVNPMSWY